MPSLVARERECQWLADELARARAGRGRLALVAGEAGVGKSRLVAAAFAPGGWRVLVGCAERAGTPYAHLTDLLRQGLRLAPEVLAGLAHLRARLAAILPELGPAAACDAAELRSVLIATVTALADAAPTALVFEDLHAADAATIDLLPALAGSQGHRPLALLGTVRDEPLPSGHALAAARAALRRQNRLRELRLAPLACPSVAEMLAGLLGSEADPRLATLIHARANGIPLFIEELIVTLRDLGRLRVGARGWELADGGGDLPLPDGIRDAVALRLDGCDDAVRTLLQAAALAQGEADEALLRRLAGEVPLEEACATGLVQWRDERLRWRHDLLREAVLAELPWSRRRTWHAAAAELLLARGGDSALVARHCEEAGDPRGARAAWLAAGTGRSRVFAHRDAMAALQRAVRAWPAGEDPDQRRRAFAALGAAALAAGEAGEAARAWREVLDEPGGALPPDERARAWRALAVATSLQGAWHASQAARREAMAAFASAGDPAEAAAERYAIGGHLIAQRRLGEAQRELSAAAEAAGAAGAVALQARILGSLATSTAMQGDMATARALVDRALRLALDANETAAAADVYRRIGSLHEMHGDYPAACDAYETALSFCRTQSLPGAARVCMGCMTWALFQAGDWRRALPIVREVTADAAATGGSRAVGHLVGGLIAALRGQARRAADDLRHAAELGAVNEIGPIVWGAAWGQALLAECAGDRPAACALYHQVLDDWESSQDLLDAVPVLCAAAGCFADQGDRTALDRVVAGLRRCADGVANAETLAGLARGLAEQALVEGRMVEARQHLAHALDLLDDCGLPLERLHATWRAALAALRADDQAAAARLARVARRMATSLRADGWTGRLRTLPEDSAATVPTAGTLTARQVEVLKLLVKGCTNRRIGALLGLSIRTVDMHVARILDRLGAGTRTEAATLAAEAGLLD